MLISEKCPDCVHHSVTIFIQNVALRLSSRKTRKCLHVGPSFSELLHPEPCNIYENKLALCNPGNTEPCHIDNPGIIRILTYLKRGTCSEPSEIFNNERFARIVKPIKYQCCPHIETSQLI